MRIIVLLSVCLLISVCLVGCTSEEEDEKWYNTTVYIDNTRDVSVRADLYVDNSWPWGTSMDSNRNYTVHLKLDEGYHEIRLWYEGEYDNRTIYKTKGIDCVMYFIIE